MTNSMTAWFGELEMIVGLSTSIKPLLVVCNARERERSVSWSLTLLNDGLWMALDGQGG